MGVLSLVFRVFVDTTGQLLQHLGAIRDYLLLSKGEFFSILIEKGRDLLQSYPRQRAEQQFNTGIQKQPRPSSHLSTPPTPTTPPLVSLIPVFGFPRGSSSPPPPSPTPGPFPFKTMFRE